MKPFIQNVLGGDNVFFLNYFFILSSEKCGLLLCSVNVFYIKKPLEWRPALPFFLWMDFLTSVPWTCINGAASVRWLESYSYHPTPKSSWWCDPLLRLVWIWFFVFVTQVLISLTTKFLHNRVTGLGEKKTQQPSQKPQLFSKELTLLGLKVALCNWAFEAGQKNVCILLKAPNASSLPRVQSS